MRPSPSHPFPTGARRLGAQGLVLCLFATLLVMLHVPPAAAVSWPLSTTPLLTWNMQGGSEGDVPDGTANSKWASTIVRFTWRFPVIMLQEAGPSAPESSRHRGNVTLTTPSGARHEIQHHTWNAAGTRGTREIFFAHTQNGRGGRVNLALVLGAQPDEVNIVENPVQAGRIALGARFGANWYFTVHGLSGGGGDSAALLNAIDDQVDAWAAQAGPNVEYTWTVGGDFNVVPDSLEVRNHFPVADVIATRPNVPTHNSGNRYDYFVTTDRTPDLGDAWVDDGPPSDHRPVGLGRMRAAGETDPEVEPQEDPPSGIRLMPIGDSITEGYGSSNESGYRDEVQDDIGKITLGHLFGGHDSTVLWEAIEKRDLVGGRNNGQGIPDTDHEGWPGHTIDQIDGRAPNSARSKRPNVVTLLAGTNDMIQDLDVANAPGRLSRLIDHVLDASPGVAIVVGTLPPSRNAGIQNRITAYNATIRTMLDDRIRRGDHLVRVELGAVTEADLADDVHPNDAGYRKIADAFTDGLRLALYRGWVKDPAAGTPSTPGAPVRGWAPQGMVASGTMSPGAHPGGLSLRDGDEVHFADLNGDGRDDYVVTHADGKVDQWTNGGLQADGSVTWHSHRTVSTPRWDVRPVWRFANMDNDRQTEMIKYDPARGDIGFYKADGTVMPSLPTRGVAGRHWFAYIDPGALGDWVTVADDSSTTARLYARFAFGAVLRIAPGVGVPGDRVRFADMDGNGSSDYLVLNPDSSVQAWLSGGFNPAGGEELIWRPQGTVATGVGVSGDRIRFADIDGDARADYLDVDPANGNTRMWRSVGVWGWEPLGSITRGNSARIHYADLDANGTVDYLQVNADSSVEAWLNGGRNGNGGEEWIWRPQGKIAGGVGTAGANVRFADLDNNGLADYVVVNPDGSVQAWLNGGRNGNGGEEWIWRPQGTIAGGVGAPGSQIRFADLNRDGLADYLRVNDNSATQAWVNGGIKPTGGDWYWTPLNTIAGGVGAPGSQIRFADLTGDDRPDYLVLHDNSSVDMWINGGPRGDIDEWLWHPQGQIASGVGVPGSQVQFGDLDGDGRDDYLDVDPRTGATRAWINTP